MIKPFSQSLHDKYDKLGRFAVKWLFSSDIIEYVDNPDVYGVDLLGYNVYTEDICRHVEVEVKASWEEGPFPYKSVNIPFRKKKFFTEPTEVWFCMVRADGNALIAIDSTDLLWNAEIVEVKNKYNKRGEPFYRVPIENFTTYGDII